MAKTMRTFTVLMTMMIMSSFTDNFPDSFIGTFGVPDSDPAQIKLTINADHTFYYQDFSVADKKISINGNWIQKGKKVTLINHDSKMKFHQVWTFAENGQVARSRKGLTFYRLCRIERK